MLRQTIRREHPRRLPTVKAIQVFTRAHEGFIAQSCWIADVKQQMGYDVRPARNRRTDARQEPCPPDKIEAIKRAIWTLSGVLNHG